MKRNLTALGLLGVGSAVTAATLPPLIANSGGLWGVSRSATGANSERRCVPNAASLSQWEHLQNQCTRLVLSSTETSAVINYTCPKGGFGRSTIKVITPRTLRIETQGIGTDGFPFNYTLHARRVGDCSAH